MKKNFLFRKSKKVQLLLCFSKRNHNWNALRHPIRDIESEISWTLYHPWKIISQLSLAPLSGEITFVPGKTPPVPNDDDLLRMTQVPASVCVRSSSSSSLSQRLFWHSDPLGMWMKKNQNRQSNEKVRLTVNSRWIAKCVVKRRKLDRRNRG